MEFIIALVVPFIAAFVMTPYVIKLAVKVGAVDKPNHRKVHTKVMPRLGGLAIYFSFLVGFLIFLPETLEAWPILAGATIIVIIGIIDDIKEVTPKVKLAGQILAAVVTVFSGIQIEFITLPNGNIIEFGYFAIPLTILWIVAITNAINLIDGLDGLAAGVSSIILLTFSGLALSMGNPFVALLGFMLFGSTLGFIKYNFHPAKIFMGDTGSLFLGYMISVFAIMGLFKNVAVFSLIIPIVILGVPILDTTFAIIRRIVHKKPLSSPDKYHLHHCLIKLGFTHRQTVIMIYCMSAIFSMAAIIFTRATVLGATITLVALIILVELVVEITGLISENYRPLLNVLAGAKTRDK